jgi:hypothetical protein
MASMNYFLIISLILVDKFNVWSFIDYIKNFGEEGILNAEESYQFEQISAAASTLMVPH